MIRMGLSKRFWVHIFEAGSIFLLHIFYFCFYFISSISYLRSRFDFSKQVQSRFKAGHGQSVELHHRANHGKSVELQDNHDRSIELHLHANMCQSILFFMDNY